MAIKYKSKFEAAWGDAEEHMITVNTGEWRVRRPVLNKDACRQCGWCNIYCPVGCMKLDKGGYFRPDLEYCKGCGICAHECPAYAIRMDMEEVG